MSTASLTSVGRTNVVSNTLTIARRYLLPIKATPEQLAAFKAAQERHG